MTSHFSNFHNSDLEFGCFAGNQKKKSLKQHSSKYTARSFKWFKCIGLFIINVHVHPVYIVIYSLAVPTSRNPGLKKGWTYICDVVSIGVAEFVNFLAQQMFVSQQTTKCSLEITRALIIHKTIRKI